MRVVAFLSFHAAEKSREAEGVARYTAPRNLPATALTKTITAGEVATDFALQRDSELWNKSRRSPKQEGDLSNRRLFEHEHHHAVESHAETAMRRHSVAEKVEIEAELGEV